MLPTSLAKVIFNAWKLLHTYFISSATAGLVWMKGASISA